MFKHRKYAMIDEIQKHIRSQLQDNSTSSKILSFIQNKYDHDSNNLILEAQDIFNYIFKLRVERLNNKTFIQALNVKLQNDFN